MSRFNLVLMNIQEQEDQENIVEELTCIKEDGLLLKIRGTCVINALVCRLIFVCSVRIMVMLYTFYIFSSDVVDELPRVELELNKARCRVKAFKVTR